MISAIRGQYLPWFPMNLSDGVEIIDAAYFMVPDEAAEVVTVNMKIRGFPVQKSRKIMVGSWALSRTSFADELALTIKEMVEQAEAELSGVI